MVVTQEVILLCISNMFKSPKKATLATDCNWLTMSNTWKADKIIALIYVKISKPFFKSMLIESAYYD